MTNKIYRSVFLTSMLVALSCLALISAILFQFFEGQIIKELKSEAEYVAYLTEREGTEFFKDFKSNEKRITLIAADGSVIADTEADAAALGNHGDRKEFKEAVRNGSGSRVRTHLYDAES